LIFYCSQQLIKLVLIITTVINNPQNLLLKLTLNLYIVYLLYL